MKKLAKIMTLTMTAGLLLFACADNGDIDGDLDLPDPDSEEPIEGDPDIDNEVDDEGDVGD